MPPLLVVSLLHPAKVSPITIVTIDSTRCSAALRAYIGGYINANFITEPTFL